MRRGFLVLMGVGVMVLGWGSLAWGAPAIPGFHPGVKVSAPTRLDWTFVLSTQSLTTLPQQWQLEDYDSTKQTYDLFVPRRRNPKAPMPLILFLSPGDDSGSGKRFEKVCQTSGWFYAAPLKAGNSCPSPRRVRIILDVLDDLRKHYPIDPDRTYITGFSGGGRVACAIAFALPELFGGVIPVCAGGDLREESWLRRRVADRLGVALVTGVTDFNRGEVERLRASYLKDVGVRTRVWTVAGMGHQVPDERVLADAVRWLEETLLRRQKMAVRYPAARLRPADDATREARAKALLAEGKARMKDKQLYPGLMLVQGVMKRFPDLEAGKEARTLLEEYEGKKEKPWEKDDLAEQRLFLVARARALDRYASGPLDARYAKMRTGMVRQAIELWNKVLADSPDSPAGKEAKKRIPVLEKLLAKE
jgi:pimeloyl-ACP methyl ester carboxylesterase